MAEQWQIRRGGERCFGTQRELAPGEEYYAALVETAEGFERRDYSGECWQAGPPEVYCYWKTHVPVKEEKKRLLVDNGILINIFERLENEQEELKVNFRFVLALILMRKKILRYEAAERREEREIWKMKMAREEKIHDVLNPHLTDEQIGQVSSELSSILNGEF